MSRFKILLNKFPDFIFSIICFFAIIYLTLSPDPIGNIPIPLFPGADKIVHGIMFGGQTITICFDIYRRKHFISLKRFQILTILIFSSTFGIIIEYLQSIMQYSRNFDFAYIIADVIGCIIFAIIWKYWLEKKI